MARLVQIVVDCDHPAGLARFWATALDEFEVRAYDAAEIERLAQLGFTPETDPVVILDGPNLDGLDTKATQDLHVLPEVPLQREHPDPLRALFLPHRSVRLAVTSHGSRAAPLP